MPQEGVDLSKTPLILAHSVEFTTLPDDVSAMLFSRSTTGRQAIEHLHAGWGECGFPGQWTFEINCLWPFKRIIKPGDCLFQLVFCRMSRKPEKNYRQKATSHYIDQIGATPNYK